MSAHIGLQAVFERFLPAYQRQHTLTPIQQKACWHIEQCRTEALGGLQRRCGQCGFEQPQHHSCRDRHCPQCQGQAQQAWCQQQLQAVLPVTYYHLVFTLPHTLNSWVELHPEVIYRCLFQSVWETLDHFGQDPKRLHGTLGMTAVLHTWGQNLSRHVHLHCLVAGGALTEAGDWHSSQSNYLFPVRALSRFFRGRMVSRLRHSAQRGELQRITRPAEIDTRLNELMHTDWVVYTKAYLNRADTVVQYLARYSRKTALSNGRIQQIDEDQVHLRYKDYRDHDRNKVMVLDGEELIRRFLWHILPTGFMRIRHYGFLANRCRRQKLAQIRQSLQAIAEQEIVGQAFINSQSITVPVIEKPRSCPQCKTGRMIVVGEIAPKRIDYG
jgi:hypothetical protein